MAAHLRGDAPAERLLEILGPVDRWHDPNKTGDFGNPARQTMQQLHDRPRQHT